MIVASAIEHLRMAVAAALAVLPQDKEGEELTGDCSEDCLERCAYPGLFSECAAPNGQGEEK